ncbi:MAG: hypothetical protein AAFQ80_15340 [Cyanobacteria bacterium J06621_8]
MTQLVTNECHKYFKTRLPNEYLISGNVYMSQASYRILSSNFSQAQLIQDAINENQFSTGAIDYLHQILENVTSNQRGESGTSSNQLKRLLNMWLMSLDLNKSVIC